MSSLPSTAALADLQALAARFKGLIELAKVLEGYSSLENYSQELAAANAAYKAENAKLLGVKLDLETAIAEAKAAADLIIAEAKGQAGIIVEAAKNEAEANRADARAALSNEIMTMAVQKEQKTKEVADLQAASEKLAADIATQEASLAKLQKAIDDLKARF